MAPYFINENIVINKCVFSRQMVKPIHTDRCLFFDRSLITVILCFAVERRRRLIAIRASALIKAPLAFSFLILYQTEPAHLSNHVASMHLNEQMQRHRHISRQAVYLSPTDANSCQMPVSPSSPMRSP